MTENEDKLSDTDKASIRNAVDEAKKDLESDDMARLDAAKQRVEAELHKVAEALYKAQNPEAAPGATEGGEAVPPDQDPDVVDAEYTEETKES